MPGRREPRPDARLLGCGVVRDLLRRPRPSAKSTKSSTSGSSGSTAAHGRILCSVGALRDELHRLIDRLPESQVAPVLALLRERTPTVDGSDEWPLPEFVGTLSSGKGDLAARSSQLSSASRRLP